MEKICKIKVAETGKDDRDEPKSKKKAECI